MPDSSLPSTMRTHCAPRSTCCASIPSVARAWVAARARSRKKRLGTKRERCWRTCTRAFEKAPSKAKLPPPESLVTSMNQARNQSVRVLFLDHVARMSGAEQSLADLVVGLAQGPIEPVVCLPADGPLAAELRAHGVLVRMVPMSKRLLEPSRTSLRNPLVAVARLGAFVAASFRLWRLIREVRPRIVHSNTLKTHLLAILPCAAARVPLVWHVRDILSAGWVRRALVACGRFANAIIVPSRAV